MLSEGKGETLKHYSTKNPRIPIFYAKYMCLKSRLVKFTGVFEREKIGGTGSDGKKGEGRGVSPSLWESQSFFSALQFLNRVYGVRKKRIRWECLVYVKQKDIFDISEKHLINE